MGVFDKIFRPQKKVEQYLNSYFKTLNAYSPVFTSVSGGLYEADITRSAIHCIATHISKLEPKVIGRNNGQLAQRLKYKPNAWQTTSQWLYRTATILLVENNAFIVPVLDDSMEIKGYYTVCPSRCEVLDYKGEAWLRYKFNSGEVGAIELSRCAVITQYQYKDDFFGENNRVLTPTIQLIHTQNEGIEEGIKSAANIRFIGKLASVLQQKDVDAERKRFRESNFATENNGGIVLIDGKYENLTQIQSHPYIVDNEQMNAIKNNVYNYFGVSEAMLRNEWDEKTYTAFYEGKIEPIALQLGLGLTCMTFNERERAFENAIEFSSNRLQYATTATKMNFAMSAFDRGLISRNEARAIFQMASLGEAGDEYVIRGEYMNMSEKMED